MISILLTGLLVVCTAMVLLWLLQLATRNAGWVDLGWTACLVFLAQIYAFQTGLNWRKTFFLAMVTLWGGRLMLHLVVRLIRDPKEDTRYASIRERWQPNLQFKLFLFFQFQAVIAWVLSLPFFLILIHPEKQLHGLEVAGFVVWLAALTGEHFADKQLAEFKLDPQNKGKVCQKGLWNYSRHPNYFFEWLIWVAYFLFALPAPYGWTAIFAPALMLHFLLNVSGIPPSEAQSLASRGDAYRDYQKTTSAFVPWFKKRAV